MWIFSRPLEELREEDLQALRPEYRDTLATLAACLAVPETRDARDQLTTRELGERLGVSTRTIRRRKTSGQLVPVDAGGCGRSAQWSAQAAR